MFIPQAGGCSRLDLSAVPLFLGRYDRAGWVAERAAGLAALGCSPGYVAEFRVQELARPSQHPTAVAPVPEAISAYEYEQEQAAGSGMH